MNKYTGETTVQLGEKKGTLVFDWRAISQLHSSFPECVESGHLNIMAVHDPVKIASILEIGFRKLSPELTQEAILEASQPIFPLKKSIDEALFYAYFGPEILEQVQSHEVDKPEKKTQ